MIKRSILYSDFLRGWSYNGFYSKMLDKRRIYIFRYRHKQGMIFQF